MTSDALDGAITVEVRGQGDTPEARVFPWVLDLGSVGVGETRTSFVRVENESALPLVVSSVVFTDSQFFTPEQMPFNVEPETFRDLEVSVTPQVAVPQTAAVSINVGQVQLQRVTLRVNDCENGTPEAYDVDGDGFTTCGGDCDDTKLCAVRSRWPMVRQRLQRHRRPHPQLR